MEIHSGVLLYCTCSSSLERVERETNRMHMHIASPSIWWSLEIATRVLQVTVELLLASESGYTVEILCERRAKTCCRATVVSYRRKERQKYHNDDGIVVAHINNAVHCGLCDCPPRR